MRNFSKAESSATQPDRSIILRLSPKDMEQVAELKSLHPGEFHNRKQIAYADQHDAGIMEVSSVQSESVAGKPALTLRLHRFSDRIIVALQWREIIQTTLLEKC
jgi:hypothetical protein